MDNTNNEGYFGKYVRKLMLVRNVRDKNIIFSFY